MKLSLIKSTAFLCYLIVSNCALAAQHAILVGIADYPVISALEGPLHDVALIKSTLIKTGRFSESDIMTLTNSNATKKNILHAIASVRTRGTPGDSVFIYFSGHGTSAADPGFPATIPTKTGALVPYDIEDVDDAQQLTDRLIIGTRDLRPLLTQLDQEGFTVLVVIDACFSGNVIRDKKAEGELPKRFVRFADLLPASQRVAKLARRLRSNPDEPFPYTRVFSLSAAREFEAAQDIPASKLDRYPTIDGKPHGAFTDSLARVLLNKHTNNGDQPLTIGELLEGTKQLMQERQFSSTPMLLPKSSSERPNPGGRAVFTWDD